MSKFFKSSETECKCGCGQNNLDPLVLSIADAARNIAGLPFVVTSAARCKIHNSNVGGVDSSSHLSSDNQFCYAIDLKAEDSYSRFKIVNALILCGVVRIGIAKTFIHFDIDGSKPKALWLY
jgi:hypothetical protein